MVSPTAAVMLGGLNAMMFVPPTMMRWSVPVPVPLPVVLVGGAAVVLVLGAVPVEAGAVEVELEVEVLLPKGLLAAAALKASNLVPGLIAKTIPCWQWFAWRQKIQTGSELVIDTWATGKLPVWLAATGWNPVSNPLAIGRQGAAKVDCVTV